MKWEKVKKYLPIIGIALFIYLIIKLDVSKVWAEIKNLNFNYIWVSLIFIISFFFIQTLKWFVIARKQKIKIPFLEAFKVNMIGNFYGFITPSKIGSIIRVDYLKKYGGDVGKGASNFVIDKILDLGSLFVLAIVLGTVFYGDKIIPQAYLNVVFIIFVVMIAVFLFFYREESSRPVLKFIYHHLTPKKMKERGKIIFESFYKDLPPLGFLLFVFFLNLLAWIINYLSSYLIGLSLGINVGFIPFLVILSISTLVTQIPITINGFGTRELTLINLFSLFGVEAVKALSLSLLGVFIIGVVPAVITLLLILYKNKKDSCLKNKEIKSYNFSQIMLHKE
jgi:glycosyltransferase 2 family protein